MSSETPKEPSAYSMLMEEWRRLPENEQRDMNVDAFLQRVEARTDVTPAVREFLDGIRAQIRDECASRLITTLADNAVKKWGLRPLRETATRLAREHPDMHPQELVTLLERQYPAKQYPGYAGTIRKLRDDTGARQAAHVVQYLYQMEWAALRGVPGLEAEEPQPVSSRETIRDSRPVRDPGIAPESPAQPAAVPPVPVQSPPSKWQRVKRFFRRFLGGSDS